MSTTLTGSCTRWTSRRSSWRTSAMAQAGRWPRRWPDDLGRMASTARRGGDRRRHARRTGRGAAAHGPQRRLCVRRRASVLVHRGDDLAVLPAGGRPVPPALQRPDRKSTRLNSSHSQISYAVFCLKKKKKKKDISSLYMKKKKKKQK